MNELPESERLPPQLRFRRPERADVDRIKELHYAGLIETGSLSNDRRLDADLDDLARTYFTERSDFLVADLAGIVVGTGAIRPAAAETLEAGEIKRMRVDTRYRSRGLGAAILQRLVASGTAFGYERLVLDTSLRQLAAQRLYRRFGFVETGRGECAGVASIFFRLDLRAAPVRVASPPELRP